MHSSSVDLGPSAEDDNDFAKELAKMVSDSAAEARKVDKRNAQILWDSAVLPSSLWKKRHDDEPEEDAADGSASDVQDVMKFSVLSKKGNKQMVRAIYQVCLIES